MPQTLQSQIASFLQYLQFQKRYSRHTIVSYQTDLGEFDAFLLAQYGNTAIGEIKPALVRTWLAALKEGGNSSRTINRKISSLKSFFKYHIKKGELPASPMAVISN